MSGAAGFGVYVHIPFCETRCTYCDFNTVTGTPPDQQARYYEALSAEWAGRELPTGPVVSVFFGGGTPSLAPAAEIARLLQAVSRRRTLAADAEVTMEMNPGTVTEASLAGYREAGVNRVSLGVQAAQGHHLDRLNRRHSFEDAVHAVVLARQAGFGNLNLDAIYGLPGQTLAEWRETVESLLTLGPEHLSLYQLQVEHGTPLARDVARGRQRLPIPDLVADMAEWAEQELPRRGLPRYEISNYARPGFHSRHNQLYWECRPYVGLGAGAHSFAASERRWNIRAVARYAETAIRGGDTAAGRESLPLAVQMGEFVWLGLRMSAGIAPSAFQERFGRSLDEAFPNTVVELIGAGLLRQEPDRVYATERGQSLMNLVAQRFLEAVS